MKATTRERPFAKNGRIIRRFREQLEPKVSQERFADIVKTSRRHMIRLEQGYHLPSRDLRDRIAEAVGTTPEAIQSSDDDEESESMEPMVRDLLAAIREAVRAEVREAVRA
jgi:transcriptional regulator with XRE-family HTH domain